jgi:hypothetical protein
MEKVFDLVFESKNSDVIIFVGAIERGASRPNPSSTVYSHPRYNPKELEKYYKKCGLFDFFNEINYTK